MENKFNYTKKILFFGMPDMGAVCLLKLADAGVNIVGVVPPPPNAPTYPQFCELAQFLKLNLIPYKKTLKDADFLARIKALNADVAIVCSYSKLFPKELLNTMPNKFVNVHPSILPNYRGPNPYSHVIIQDEKTTGITLHLMDETFDTGNMIGTRKLDIDEDETMGTLFNKLNFTSADFLIEFCQKLEENMELKGVEQPKGEYLYAYDISAGKGNNTIDWSKDAKYIDRFVRALNPFISAVTMFRGVPIKVHSVRVLDKKINARPGTVLNVEKGLFVNTGDGIIELKVVQVGSYCISNGRYFVKKFNIAKGEKFGE